MTLVRDLAELIVAGLAIVRGRRSPDLTPGAAQLGRWLGGSVTVLGFVWTFHVSGELQKGVCTMAGERSVLSDFCGDWDLGERPTRQGRLDWDKLRRTTPGRCDALTAYLTRYPKGVRHDEATDLLSQRHTSATGPFTPIETLFPIHVSNETPPSSNQAAALADSLARAGQKAKAVCQEEAQGQRVKLISAAAQPQVGTETCERLDSGYVCGLDAQAVCRLNEPVETCGVPSN